MMRLARILLLSLFCLAMASCHRSRGQKVLKLAHGLNVDHPVHAAMIHLAQRVREKSNGALVIEVYPGGQLGSERECIELLQIGSLAMTKVSSAVLESFVPAYRVYSLPYLFEDEAHCYRVLDGEVGREILLSGEPYYLRGLCYYDAGFRSFYARKPIETAGDLARMKIRTQESPMAFALVKAMDASPTPIAWGELYSALQQGVVDGAENNPPSFHTSNHYQVCRYYVLNEHTSVPDVMLISAKVWNRLNEDQRRWLQEAADDSAQYERALWHKATEEALAKVQEAGVRVIRPDKAPFAAKAQPVYEPYLADPTIGPLIQRIRAQRGGR